MKKLIAIFCIFYSGFSNLYAQSNKWSVGISFGVASPAGKFGNKDIFDSTSAFAKTGPALNVEGNYRLNRHIAFALLLTGQQNSVDTKTMVDKYQKAISGAFFNINSGDWNIGKIMGGINLSMPFDEKEKFQGSLRLMAGALKTTFPKITVTEAYYSDSLGNVARSQFQTSKVPLSWTFAWLAGLGLRYNLTKNHFVQATFDYSASSPEAPNYPIGIRAFVPGTYPISGSAFPVVLPNSTNSRTYKQPINSINICIGIGIAF